MVRYSKVVWWLLATKSTKSTKDLFAYFVFYVCFVANAYGIICGMKDLFGRIAPKYDRMNRIMSLSLDRRWRRAALDLLPPTANPLSLRSGAANSQQPTINYGALGDRALPTTNYQPPTISALDLACGTGDFAAALLERHPSASITCVDLTPEMLDIARAKLANAPDVRFLAADAQNLSPFGDGSFDLVVCAFGFRNFPDKAKALAECRRILAPGGELVVLELFRPRSRLLGGIVRMWLAVVAAIFAGGSRKEYAYLRSSVAGTVTANEFIRMAKDAGFTSARRRFLFPAATALAFS